MEGEGRVAEARINQSTYQSAAGGDGFTWLPGNWLSTTRKLHAVCSKPKQHLEKPLLQLTVKSVTMGKSASKQFAEEVLRTHNDYRKQHGVPALKLCKKLNREAQQYSEALASTRILKHSPESSSGNCGENLAWASYDQSGKEVADRWYSEIKNYNYASPGFSSDTGHFTAMVWKSTKKMGVGKAAASDGSTFVVARYEPAGNIVNPGHYEQNVLPPKK